ncbi:SPASM domain-containing protein [Streptomyces sp. NPDC058766]|uniref:SPASM domain-containing protein n=1 Tax=Streptomyces sp. NPDC058766 TaxID=3346630 RepID=UPI00369DCA60
MFDAALANWYGEQPSLCVHSRSCGSALALEHNGDLYSCDHFVEPEHLLGNIGERHLLDLVDSPRQRKFGQDEHDTLPRYCLDCDVRFACHGGCPKDRFTTTPVGEPGLNHLCAGYKAFFHHLDRPMRAMAGLLRRGRPPRADHAPVRGSRHPPAAQRPLPLRRRTQVGPPPRQARGGGRGE